MKNANSKRLLTLVLALVLVFALSVGAYAAWTSFQKDATNNGTVPSGVTPPTSSPAPVMTVPLSTNGYPYSGVDVTPVISGDTSYVLYNGGDVNGTDGGARLAAIDLTSTVPASATKWDIQLDANASNDQQISTPYYAGNNTLYAGVTYYTDALASIPMSSWSSGAISGGVLTIPAGGTVTLSLNSALLNGSYAQAYFNTGITSAGNGDLSGSVYMYNNVQQISYYYGTSSSWAGSKFCLYNQNGNLLPSGTYTVTIELTNNTNAAVTTSHISLMVSAWKLYKVTATDTTSPVATPVSNGLGQISTPITAGGGYLYFGIYEGDRCYYQFDPSNPNDLRHFSTYSGSGYYWAGATVVNISGTDYVFFGDENGIIYRRPVGSAFDSGTGLSYYLNTQVTNPGAVHSSICYSNGYLYFTSVNAYLWKFSTSLGFVGVVDMWDDDYVQKTTSTPVVSDNSYIYVGGYNIDYTTYSYKGTIVAVPVANFDDNHLTRVWDSDYEAVQSSIVTYSTTYYDEEARDDLAIDYLYVTTNGPMGKGRCIDFVPYYAEGDEVWDISAPYSLQGFAVSDGSNTSGKIVFGNDSNNFFIVG